MEILKICGLVILINLLLAAFILAAALLFLEFYPSVGAVPDREKQREYAGRTKLYYNKKFHNEVAFSAMTGHSRQKSDMITPPEKLPVRKINAISRCSDGELRVTWLGHSSSLVQMGRRNILIDPVMSERCSPVSFAGSKRFSEFPADAGDFGSIDVLFISHDHYDHLDYRTIRRLDPSVADYVVPLGVDVILKGWGVDEGKLHALEWWESVSLGGVEYTLTPGRHFTCRNPLKSCATLWGGLYMKDGAHSVYFTGDTGYYDVFGRVHERLGGPDLILAESGQYSENWANTHMFPEQTAQAAKDAGAKWMIPVHWGTFALSTHAWDDPPRRVVRAAEKLGVNIATPRIGQMISYDNIAEYNEHWWEKPQEK